MHVKGVRKWFSIAAFAAAVLLACGCAVEAQDITQRPNILFIQTDDLDRGVFEKAMPKTHTLIANEGVTFENAFFSTPLCCPSRSSIFRGQYPHNTGVYHNSPPNGGFDTFYKNGLHEYTYGTALDEAGYWTAYIGKVLNGYGTQGVPAPVLSGYDYFAGRFLTAQTFNINGKVTTFPTTIQKPAKPDYKMCRGNKQCINRKRNAYARKVAAYHHELRTGIYGIYDQIVEKLTLTQIEQTHNSDTPFLIATNLYAPHASTGPMYPESYGTLYRDAQLPTDGSFNEADVSDKPAWLPSGYPLLSSEERSWLTTEYRKRLRSARFADDVIGRLIAKLQEMGELDNTYIVFWTDNGFHMGQHRLPFGKSSPYTEDVNFPMLMRGPGIQQATRDEFVSGVD